MSASPTPAEMAVHQRIDALDVTLFDAIQTESSHDDRRSFLALQSACRQWKGRYAMLEIGSYRGGSLQGYVVDPACTRIVSIDPRSAHTKDQRDYTFDYSIVTAEQMVASLRALPGADTAKIRAINAGTDSITVDSIGITPDLCFIDGEHTDDAVVRDSRFCLAACGADAVLVYHDAHIVYKGLRTVIEELTAQRRPFRAYQLPSVVFVIELGECRLSAYEPLRSWRDENYKGYLESLMLNDPFRDIAMRHERRLRHPVMRAVRKLNRLPIIKRLLDPR